MSATPHDPKAASPIKDVLVPCLLLIVGALLIVCGWQRAELGRLKAAQAGGAAGATPPVRMARAKNFVATPHPLPGAGRPSAREDDGGEFAVGGGGFNLKPRPATTSPLARLLNNPEFFQALQLHRRSTLDARFASLFRQLALSADELAALKRLLVEKENAALDVIMVSEAQPDGPLSDALLGASVNAARARADDDIHAALGDDRYAVYSDYEKSLPQRAIVAQLEQRLSYSPTPLSPTQSESLVKILAAHAPAPAGAETAPTSAVVVATGALEATGIDMSNPPAVVSDDALAEAQSLLAPHQVAALREIQVEQQATNQTMQLLRDTLPVSDNPFGRTFKLLLQ